MARTLILVRHGKAGQAPGRPDRDRPLTENGRRVAMLAGEWLRAREVRPDAVVCSTATRARQTWEAMNAALGEPAPTVSYEQQVYEGGVDTLLQVAAESSAEVATVALVGHNPSMHALVNELTGAALDGFPAGTVAVLDVPMQWGELGPGAATLRAVSHER